MSRLDISKYLSSNLHPMLWSEKNIKALVSALSNEEDYTFKAEHFLTVPQQDQLEQAFREDYAHIEVFEVNYSDGLDKHLEEMATMMQTLAASRIIEEVLPGELHVEANGIYDLVSAPAFCTKKMYFAATSTDQPSDETHVHGRLYEKGLRKGEVDAIRKACKNLGPEYLRLFGLQEPLDSKSRWIIQDGLPAQLSLYVRSNPGTGWKSARDLQESKRRFHLERAKAKPVPQSSSQSSPSTGNPLEEPHDREVHMQ